MPAISDRSRRCKRSMWGVKDYSTHARLGCILLGGCSGNRALVAGLLGLIVAGSCCFRCFASRSDFCRRPAARSRNSCGMSPRPFQSLLVNVQRTVENQFFASGRVGRGRSTEHPVPVSSRDSS